MSPPDRKASRAGPAASFANRGPAARRKTKKYGERRARTQRRIRPAQQLFIGLSAWEHASRQIAVAAVADNKYDGRVGDFARNAQRDGACTAGGDARKDAL